MSVEGMFPTDEEARKMAWDYVSTKFASSKSWQDILNIYKRAYLDLEEWSKREWDKLTEKDPF